MNLKAFFVGVLLLAASPLAADPVTLPGCQSPVVCPTFQVPSVTFPDGSVQTSASSGGGTVHTNTTLTGDGSAGTPLAVNPSSVPVFGPGGTLTVASSVTASAFFGDGSHLTGVTSGSTVSTTASLYGDGTSGNPLGVKSSSVAVLSNGFVLNSQLDPSSVTKQGFVALSNLSGAVPSGRVDFSTITTALAGKLSTTTAVPNALVDLSTVTTAIATKANKGANSDITSLSALSLISSAFTATSSMTNTSTQGILVYSSVTASAFFGDGSHLTGITGGSGSCNPGVGLDSVLCMGLNNTADGPYSVVSGGESNTAPNDHAAVVGGFTNTASGDFGFVGGGENNSVTSGHATIAGGSANGAAGLFSTVGGGSGNHANGDDSVVSGGEANTASGADAVIAGGNTNSSSGIQTVVSGGVGNVITSSDYGVIGGGNGNTVTSAFYGSVLAGQTNAVTGQYGTIGGGQFGAASGYSSTIAGGQNNTAGGLVSAVAGGTFNTASGDQSFVGGGNGNSATNNHSAIVGGGTNNATGAYGTIGGGQGNLASGQHSTVPGGTNCQANGDDSIAAGTNARSLANGAFTFSDGQGGNFDNSTQNAFAGRFQGGYNFTGGGPATFDSTLAVSGDFSVIGASATIAGQLHLGYEIVTANCTTATTCVATCSTDNSVLGGGCNATINISGSFPDTPTSWTCNTLLATTIDSYVICARLAN